MESAEKSHLRQKYGINLDVIATVHKESFLRRIRRRALTFTILTICVILSTPLAICGMPLALLKDRRTQRVAGKPSAYMRCIAMLVVWVWMELFGVAIALLLTPARLLGTKTFQNLHRALQRWWVTTLMSAVKLLFNVRLEVTGADALQQCPGVMLVRHSSLIDTLIPALLLADSGARFRYVLKQELLYDPCLDLVGCRLPNAFISRSGNPARELNRLSNLAKTTGDNETVIIYPEGTRYTAGRRDSLIGKLRERGSARAKLASQLLHTLPPRPSGTLALLEHLGDRPVVVVAHVGFEGVAQAGDMFRGSLVGRRIALRMWRIDPDDIPKDDDARREWLDHWWTQVDHWVGQNLHQPHDGTPPMRHTVRVQ